jgi:hypothetical protein
MTIQQQIDEVLKIATPEQIRAILIWVFRHERLPEKIEHDSLNDCVGIIDGKIYTGIESNGHTHQ